MPTSLEKVPTSLEKNADVARKSTDVARKNANIEAKALNIGKLKNWTPKIKTSKKTSYGCWRQKTMGLFGGSGCFFGVGVRGFARCSQVTFFD